MTAAHSLLGASGAHRWLNCPGSFALTRTLPPAPTSIYAATGTAAHDVIEVYLRDAVLQGLPPGSMVLSPDFAGKQLTVEGHTVTLDEDFIAGVNVMLGYVRQAHGEWNRFEFQVSLDGFFATPPPVKLFGRVDVASVQDNTLEIVDYKNGAGVIVPPKDNPQLLYYAAGTLLELDNPDMPAIERVKLTVVQPHAPGTEPIRSWEISTIDVLMWIDEVLKPGVEACTQDDAPLVPGPWCRFCPALHACPRLMKDAVEMAKRDFDDAVIPNDPAELASALDIAEHAMIWAEAVQKHALEQMQRQVRIPGWDMVPTRPTRKWIDGDQAAAAALAKVGVKQDVIYETRVRSPAQVEKVLGRGNRIWTDISDMLVHAVSSGFKIARSDRADAGAEFADVE